MNIEPLKKSNKIKHEEIADFENQINYKLPKYYREFLLKYNGGTPKPNIFKTKNNEYESDIQTFYGLHAVKNYNNLEYHYNLLQDRLHKSSLAIANDSGGNFIILKLTSGQVLFFDHEVEKLFLISYSFNSFIKKLYSIEEKESELETAFTTQNISYFENLINSGTDINEIKNEFNQSIPVAAALWDRRELLKFFIDNGAKLDGVLYNAASRGRKEVVEYLLTLPGINIEERSQEVNNNTALISASHSGHFEVAKLLIEKGANLNKVDDHGRNALDKSRWSENKELIGFLEKKYKSKL